MGYWCMSGWLDTYVSGDQFGSDQLFVHVATLRISEVTRSGSYRNEMEVCNRRGKGLMSGDGHCSPWDGFQLWGVFQQWWLSRIMWMMFCNVGNRFCQSSGLVMVSDRPIRLGCMHAAQSWIYAPQSSIPLFSWFRNHSESSCQMSWVMCGADSAWNVSVDKN